MDIVSLTEDLIILTMFNERYKEYKSNNLWIKALE